jgi:hypothetical protein
VVEAAVPVLEVLTLLVAEAVTLARVVGVEEAEDESVLVLELEATEVEEVSFKIPPVVVLEDEEESDLVEEEDEEELELSEDDPELQLELMDW